MENVGKIFIWGLFFIAGLFFVSCIESADALEKSSFKSETSVPDVVLIVDTLSAVVDGNRASPEELLSDPGADGFISLPEAVTAANNAEDGFYEIYFDVTGTIYLENGITLKGMDCDHIDGIVLASRSIKLIGNETNPSAVIIDGSLLPPSHNLAGVSGFHPNFPIVIKNLTFQNSPRGGLDIGGCYNQNSSSIIMNGNLEVRNNRIINLGEAGISIAGDNNRYSNVLVADNHIQESHSFGGMWLNHVDDSTFTGNTIVDAMGPYDSDHGFELRDSFRNVLSYNTILDARGDSILLCDRSSYNQVLHNYVDDRGLIELADYFADYYYNPIPEANPVKWHNDSLHVNVGASFNTIAFNTFVSSFENAIQIGGDGSKGNIEGNRVISNTIINPGRSHFSFNDYELNEEFRSAGIVVNGPVTINTEVKNNIIYGGVGPGVLLAFRSVGTIVKNNTVYGQEMDGIQDGEEGAASATIENNLLVNNGIEIEDYDTGYGLSLRPPPFLVNQDGLEAIEGLYHNLIIQYGYNGFWENLRGNYNDNNNQESSSNDLYVDPLFVDPDGESYTDLNENHLYDEGEPFVDENSNGIYDWPDFRLSSESPAIDAGNPADDCNNELQPNGGRVNIGAYGNTEHAANGCLLPEDGMLIESDIHFCAGTYTLSGARSVPAIQVVANDVNLYCHDTTFSGVDKETMGIQVAGYRNVKIHGCTFSNYAVGVSLDRNSEATLSNITFEDNKVGVYLYEAKNNELKDVAFINSSEYDVYSWQGRNNSLINSVVDEDKLKQKGRGFIDVYYRAKVQVLPADGYSDCDVSNSTVLFADSKGLKTEIITDENGVTDFIPLKAFRLGSWFKYIHNVYDVVAKKGLFKGRYLNLRLDNPDETLAIQYDPIAIWHPERP